VTFAHAGLAVLALAVLPAAFVALRVGSILQRQSALVYSNLPFLSEALHAPAWPAIVLDAVYACGLAFLLLAAAHPRFYAAFPVPATIVLCLDTSGSMRLRDVAPSRAQAALEAARSLATSVPAGTRVGIVSFAGAARYVGAPSADRNVTLAALDSIPPPNGQTAIGDALRVALTMRPTRIVLITDGTNNHGEDPGNAVRALRALHVRLDIAGVGGGALSERALRSYAHDDGGTFARVRSATELKAHMIRLTAKTVMLRTARDCSVPFALAGLSLITGGWVAAQRGAFRP
jgi:Ca-activated chloride channel family protein